MRSSDWSSDVCSSDLAALDLLGGQAVVQGVVERAQIGIDLFLHVAGQETELLPRFDRGTREDQALDAAGDKLRDRLRDREIGLAGARAIGRASWRERVCLYV